MASVDSKLREWVGAELIPQDVADRITAYESKKPKRAWFLYGLFALGATVIAIGVVSLIAANWEDIPSSVKLGANLAVLMALAFGAYTATTTGRDILFEGALVLYSFLVLASIGLISQVYHTGGEIYQALLFWSVITFGVALVSRRLMLPFIWTMIMGAAAALALVHTDLFSVEPGDDDAIVAIFLAGPFICIVLTRVLSMLGRGEMFRRAFLFWSFALGLAVELTADVVLSAEEPLRDTTAGLPLIGVFGVVALILIALRRGLPRVTRTLLLITTGLLLVSALAAAAEIESEIIGPFLSIPTYMCAALFFGVAGYRWFFNVITIGVGVRFLIIYFQVLGDLAATGIGLIVSGAIILGMAFVWYKNRDRLAGLVQRLGSDT